MRLLPRSLGRADRVRKPVEPLEQPVAAHPWPLAPRAVVPADNDDDGGGVVVSTPRLAPKPIRPENRDYDIVPGGCAPASPAASGLFSCL